VISIVAGCLANHDRAHRLRNFFSEFFSEFLSRILPVLVTRIWNIPFDCQVTVHCMPIIDLTNFLLSLKL
jgi:hypothetical protein